MKRSKIGLIAVVSLIFNTVLTFQPLGIHQADATSPGYNGKILIQSNRTGNNELFVVNADGTNPINITNNPANDTGGRWSPDGTKIAFNSNRDGNPEAYVMNADGSNLIRLTNNTAADYVTDWSPDGTKLLFQSNRIAVSRQWIMNVDGSNPTCVTCDMPVAEHVNSKWSPTGERIAFQVNGAGNGIFTIKIDGSDPVQLTTNGVGHDPDHTPYWSPDGKKIIYSSPRASGYQNLEIYQMDADGSNEVRLTNNGLYENQPHVSPDGKKIGFTRADDFVGNPGSRDAWIMNRDGTNAVRLFQSGFIDFFSGWQPIPNTAPVLSDKALVVKSGQSGMIDVLAGATDEEELSAANITITAQPDHGSAAIESGKVKYTPNTHYVGVDKLTYQICDSFVLDQKCSTANLSIEVKPLAVISKLGDKVIENGTEKILAPTNRPTFSGTATPYSTVKVEIHSDPIILTTTADENGNWSITPDQDLPPGDHTVYISATLNGVTTELDSFVLAVQQTVPNTGFDSLPTRIGGGVLLIFGLSLAYWQRRRMCELVKCQVPQLFP